MDDHITDSFAEGFVKACFDNGVHEKVAAAMLDSYLEKRAFWNGVANLGRGLWGVGSGMARGAGNVASAAYKMLPHRLVSFNKNPILKSTLAAGEAGAAAVGLDELGKTDTSVGRILHAQTGAGEWMPWDTWGGRNRRSSFDPSQLSSFSPMGGAGGSDSGSTYNVTDVPSAYTSMKGSRGLYADTHSNNTPGSTPGSNDAANNLSRGIMTTLSASDKDKYNNTITTISGLRQKESEMAKRMASITDPILRGQMENARAQIGKEIAEQQVTLRELADKDNAGRTKFYSANQDAIADAIARQNRQVAETRRANELANKKNKSPWEHVESWLTRPKGNWRDQLQDAERLSNQTQQLKDYAKAIEQSTGVRSTY